MEEQHFWTSYRISIGVSRRIRGSFKSPSAGQVLLLEAEDEVKSKRISDIQDILAEKMQDPGRSMADEDHISHKSKEHFCIFWWSLCNCPKSLTHRLGKPDCWWSKNPQQKVSVYGLVYDLSHADRVDRSRIWILWRWNSGRERLGLLGILGSWTFSLLSYL